MKTVILARWTDNTRLETDLEVYDGDQDVDMLLDFCIRCKSFFQHTVVSKNDTYIMFSDGSRVELEMYEIQEILDDRQIIGTGI